MATSDAGYERYTGENAAEIQEPPPSATVANRKKALIVDDEALIRLSLKKLFEREGFAVLTAGSGASALKVLERETPEIVILDVRLPDTTGHALLKTVKEVNPETVVIMITGHGDIRSSVEAMKLGAQDFLEKPLDFKDIKDFLRRLGTDKARPEKKCGAGDLVYESDVMKDVVRITDSLSTKSDVTVLILGESGTGKNVLSRRIHELSSRRNRPFVEICCSNIPDHLMESELFGHNKGAFTDAKEAKKGLFESAQGGTVLLDEIGDMPYQMQSKILTFMEEKKFRKIGGLDYVHADVRILAATNRDLPTLVHDKKFRLDLFYRLNVATVKIAPLRERRADIPPLVRYYLCKSAEQYGIERKDISMEAMTCLREYEWPGNVRELRNLIERAVLLSKGDEITAQDVQPNLSLGEKEDAPFQMGVNEFQKGMSLKAVEEAFIKRAFELAQGNQRKTARLLDISRDTLRYRLKKMGLTHP
jgi:two-component system, NtrC family, response regulator AtoC